MEFHYFPSSFAELGTYRHCQGHNSWSSMLVEKTFVDNMEILLTVQSSPSRSSRRPWLQIEEIALLALCPECGPEEGSWAVSTLKMGEYVIPLKPIS